MRQVARETRAKVRLEEEYKQQQEGEKQIIQLKPWTILTVCVVPVSTLSMGEDSKQSFQHQRERAGQQGSEGGGQGSAWGSQGPLGGWDDCPHGLAEVARPQDDGGDIQLKFDAAAIDLGIATTQSHQGCLCAKCFDVSTTVAWEQARYTKVS